MKKYIDTQNHTVLKQSNLKKTGDSYSVVLLSHESMDQILDLQDKVLDSLSEQEKNFLVRKV